MRDDDLADACGARRPSAPRSRPPEPRKVVQHPPARPCSPRAGRGPRRSPSWRFDDGQPDYELPPLALLTSPASITRHTSADEALEENARMLEAVLDDYGVKGEIV